MKRVATIVLSILAAALPAGSCHCPEPPELAAARARELALFGALALDAPWLLPVPEPGIEIVEPRDLDELKEQLGPFVETVRVPEEVDFEDREEENGKERGGWWVDSGEGKERPPLVGGYARLPSGKFWRTDFILHHDREPLRCEEEFVVSITDRRAGAGCARAVYEALFDEMKLRALAEAMRYCQRVPACQTARPTRIIGALWQCDGPEAILQVDFAYECGGD